MNNENSSTDLNTYQIQTMKLGSLSYLSLVSCAALVSYSRAASITRVGNPCNAAFTSGFCDVCTGDCDSDNDCDGSMRCAQRSTADGSENVPACDFADGNRYATDDFCFSVQTVAEGVINYVGECGAEGYTCSHCEGDCDRYVTLLKQIEILNDSIYKNDV